VQWLGGMILTQDSATDVRARQLVPIPVSTLDATPAVKQSVVFVAGPFGPFLSRLGVRLRQNGARATRIIFNGGELLDWGPVHAQFFLRPAEQWRSWIHARLIALNATDLVVYGDGHPYCTSAVQETNRLGIRVHVLEQGYFRPHWVTLERDGVNGNSRLPKDPDFYRTNAQSLHRTPPIKVGQITPMAVVNITVHHLVQLASKPFFLNYRSPYECPPYQQCASHLFRYLTRKRSQRLHQIALMQIIESHGPIYLALLQRPGDSQLIRHSPFFSMAEYIECVIRSFAQHAPADARLIFKAHPLDHGIEKHEDHIRQIANDLGVGDRCAFIGAGHLASLLRLAEAVITVNSTAGLTAIEFGRPTVALGDAIYDMPGLTHQGGIDSIWTTPDPVDADLYRAFRLVVTGLTQVNGAYSTRRNIRLAVEGVARRLCGLGAAMALDTPHLEVSRDQVSQRRG